MADSLGTVGFIGGGNMGEAIMGALIRSGVSAPSSLIVSDVFEARLEELARKLDVRTTLQNADVFAASDVLLLAVKPQQMAPVLDDLADFLADAEKKRRLVISIAAGYPLGKMESVLYEKLDEAGRGNTPIIRVMPNTPALVLAGMSAMSPNRFAVDADTAAARAILSAMGKVVERPESDMDAVTALSGSGPAYVFFLIESMIAAGEEMGFDTDTATTLALTTAKGAVALMEESGESAETLRKKVTSKGGTTEAALKVMMGKDVKNTVVEAILAARNRARELAG